MVRPLSVLCTAGGGTVAQRLASHRKTTYAWCSLLSSHRRVTGKAEFFSEAFFTSPSIERTLACFVTVWDGPARHEEGNPYNPLRLMVNQVMMRVIHTGYAATSRCSGCGWPSIPSRRLFLSFIWVPARKAWRMHSFTPCDRSWLLAASHSSRVMG